MSPDKTAAIDRLSQLYESAKDLVHSSVPFNVAVGNELIGIIQEMRNIAAEAIRGIDPHEKLNLAKGYLHQALGELNYMLPIDFTAKCFVDVPEDFYRKKYGYDEWENMNPGQRNDVRRELFSKLDAILSATPDVQE